MDYIDRFVHYIKNELNLSQNTVAAYSSDLKEWREFAVGESTTFEPRDVTPGDLRTWLASCRRQGRSTVTLRRKLQSLRAFYRYMMRYEGMTDNPASDLQSAKMPHPLPVQLRSDETERMLDDMSQAANDDAADFEAVRDALIMEMLYDLGLRCQELVDLSDAGVDTSRGVITVMGKRAKERMLPMMPSLHAAIDRYRDVRSATTGVSSTDAFFVRADGRPLYRRLVYTIVHRAMSDAGVHAQRLSPHVMRHSCATDMLNSGADLNTVREMLGHASLATTQIYTHLTYRDLQQNYQHAHPRALKRKENNHGS